MQILPVVNVNATCVIYIFKRLKLSMYDSFYKLVS